MSTNSEDMKMAVERNPRDSVAVLAMCDALIEDGVNPLTAKRLATAHHVKCVANMLVKDSSNVRAKIRHEVGRMPHSSIPITVVKGRQPPTLSGDDAHSTFKSGYVCNSPGAVIKAGYKIVYHRSTLKITVGDLWVVSKLDKKSKPKKRTKPA